MSKIEELILQFCPNGVEQKRIKDVFKRIKGTPITAGKMKEIQSTSGEIKVFAGGRTVVNAKEIDIPNANITRVPAVLVQSRGVIDVVYFDRPFTFKNEMWAYTNNEQVTVKYLYYYLKNNIQYFRDQASGMGSLPQISLPTTEEFQIPVPPLEIQHEIVKTLDLFTTLEAELEAELEARKMQYTHYRDCLLGFEGKEVEWKTLGELGEFIRGNGLQKKDFTESGVGCIHYGQIYTHYGSSATKTKTFVSPDLAKKLKKARKNDLIIAGVSENVEDVCKAVVWLGDEDICISGDAFIFRHKQNPKYIGYLLQTKSFLEFKKKYAQGAKVTRLQSGRLPQFKVPIPSLNEQERIASILEKFDALVNDISIGLPAEIQSRRKQYEYYRNRLLTFKCLNHDLQD